MPGRRRFSWVLALCGGLVAAGPTRAGFGAEPPSPEDPEAAFASTVNLTEQPIVTAGPDLPPPPPEPVLTQPEEAAPSESDVDEPLVDEPTDPPAELPTEKPTGLPGDLPSDLASDLPSQVPADFPTDWPADEPEPETDTAAEAAEERSGHDYPAEPAPALEFLEPAPLEKTLDLHHLALTDPLALGALSIGTPDGGLLFNPVAMPEGELWKVRDPRETFGTAETVDYIVAAIESVEARYPGSPRLVIGDISRPDGGRLNRHKSHQAGRDVDIGLYLRTGEAATLAKPGKNQLDVPRTWTLLRAFVIDTDVERVFLDRSLQRVLYAHALADGEDKAWLDDIFGRKDAGKNALIQHERRHQDHMHVRFYNPHAQEKGRVAYPALLAAGLVPPPTVTHRVRSGETLGLLARKYGTSTASIRKANGLRTSFLRAGRSYVIPVRKVPAQAPPVAIPPRRLPPPDETLPPIEVEATGVGATGAEPNVSGPPL